MDINVLFGGLMLICLNGQQDCPVGNFGNTAWVVEADGKSMPCKWNSPEVTELELYFSANDFDYSPGSKLNCNTDNNTSTTRCTIPASITDICINPNSAAAAQQIDSSLQQVPRLAEIDRRFIKLDTKLLKDTRYVPTRIHFPPGVIAAGTKWPDDYNLTQWSRSDGSKGAFLPRALSDKLKVTYQGASTLELTTCDGYSLMTITLKQGPRTLRGHDVTFRNRAKDPIKPDTTDEKYDDLAYLLWYDALGVWDTYGGKCPEYSDHKKDAVLLRCSWYHKTSCANPTGAADTTHWPPMLGHSY